jgi:CheY-like chemotaxis protein
VSKCILIAEDNAADRTALGDILRALPDCECVETEDGQAAWQRLRAGLRPDLCVFDIQMPGLDGAQLLANIRRDPSMTALKVVFASSVRDRDTVMKLAQLRISGYLLKPYDPAKTRALVTPLLGSPPAAPARTVLLVDDQRTDRAAFCAIIQSQPGWTVIEEEDGEKAWERLQQGLRPDLAIFDLRMPQLDGRALLTRIRGDARLGGLRVAIISSTNDRDEIMALARLQISGYLLKPFEPAKVRAVLQAVSGA